MADSGSVGIQVRLVTDELKASVEAGKAELGKLNTEIKVDVDTAKLAGTIDEGKAELKKLDTEVEVTADLVPLEAQALAAKTDLEKLNVRLQIDFEEKQVNTKIADLKKEFAKLSAEKVTPEIQIKKDQIVADIKSVTASLEPLKQAKLKIDVDPSEVKNFDLDLNALRGSSLATFKSLKAINFTAKFAGLADLKLFGVGIGDLATDAKATAFGLKGLLGLGKELSVELGGAGAAIKSFGEINIGSLKGTGDGLKGIGDAAKGASQELLTASKTLGAFALAAAAIYAAVDTYKQATAATDQANKASKEFAATQKELQAAFGNTKTSGGGYAQSIKEITANEGFLQQNLDKVRSAFKDTTEAESIYYNKVEANATAVELASKAQFDYATVMAKVAKGQYVSAETLDALKKENEEAIAQANQMAGLDAASAVQKQVLIKKLQEEGAVLAAKIEAQKLAENVQQQSVLREEKSIRDITSAQSASNQEIKRLQLAGVTSAEEAQRQITEGEISATQDRLVIEQRALKEQQATADAKGLNSKEAAAKVIELTTRIEADKTAILDKAIQQREKREQDAIDRVSRTQKQAVNVATEAEQQRQIDVQTLLNRGVIDKEEADKKQLASTNAKLTDEYNANVKQLADLAALPQPAGNDPKKFAERADQISQIRQKQNSLTLSLLKNEEEAQKRLYEAAIKQLDVQKNALENQAKLGASLGKIRQEEAKAQEAFSSLIESRANRELGNIAKAKELRQELTTLSVTDGEKRTAIEQRLAELGFTRNTTELQFVEKKQAKENELAAIRARALEAKLASEKASLEVTIEQEKIQQKIAEITAKTALIKAEESKDSTAIKNAEELIGLTKTLGEDLQASARVRRDSLDTQQQQSREEAKATEEARKFDQKLELIDAKHKSIKKTVDDTTKGLHNSTEATNALADASQKLADGFLKAAGAVNLIGGNIQQTIDLTKALDATVEGVKASMADAAKVGGLYADKTLLSLGSQKVSGAAIAVAGQDKSLPPEVRAANAIAAKEAALKDAEAVNSARAKVAELQAQSTIGKSNFELAKRQLEIEKAQLELARANKELQFNSSATVKDTKFGQNFLSYNGDIDVKKVVNNPFAFGLAGANNIPPSNTPSNLGGGSKGAEGNSIKVENINIIDRKKPDQDAMNALIQLGKIA